MSFPPPKATSKSNRHRSPVGSIDSAGTSRFEETIEVLKELGCDELGGVLGVVEAFQQLNQTISITFLEMAVS